MSTKTKMIVALVGGAVSVITGAVIAAKAKKEKEQAIEELMEAVSYEQKDDAKDKLDKAEKKEAVGDTISAISTMAYVYVIKQLVGKCNELSDAYEHAVAGRDYLAHAYISLAEKYMPQDTFADVEEFLTSLIPAKEV